MIRLLYTDNYVNFSFYFVVTVIFRGLYSEF